MQLLSLAQTKENLLALLRGVNFTSGEMGIYLSNNLKDSAEKNSLLYHALVHITNIPTECRTNICSEISKFLGVGLDNLNLNNDPTTDSVIKFNICDLIKSEFSDNASHWPKYSGEETYPVPYKFPIGEDGYVSPYCVFWENHLYNTLWEGEYGVLHRQLLSMTISLLKDLVG